VREDEVRGSFFIIIFYFNKGGLYFTTAAISQRRVLLLHAQVLTPLSRKEHKAAD